MIRYFSKIGLELQEMGQLEQASWIHISPDIDIKELGWLSDKLDFPLDFLTDSLDIDERSRYEREENARLVLINTPIINNKDTDREAIYITLPIGIVLLEDHIITVSARENPIMDRFLNNKVKNFKPEDKKLFVLQILEQNVYAFLADLKKLNLKRNLIEQELYNSSRNKELQQLLRIEKSLVYFVTALSTNELLKMKMKRTDFLGIRDLEFHSDLFEDLIIDNSQALEMSNVYTNILSGTMEAYASIVSNNLNVFIQRLTIITIILMVPTLVASFYGMNLKHLPFDESPLAFPLIILGSVILGLILIWFFSRNRKIY